VSEERITKTRKDESTKRNGLLSKEEMNGIHFAQLLSYLRASGIKVGLLLNFAKPKLEIRRVVN
jgi:hypothetical protein